jgi:PadR family transcriptional regulator, regulatory protein AphA
MFDKYNLRGEKLMSLRHAILGFLNMRPFSGYDLWKMFNGSVNNYWSATNTQIYRTLSELAEKKMVEIEVIQQETNPNKKVYHLTETGKEELLIWLKTPLDLTPVRDKFLVQFSFSDILKSDDIINNIITYIKKIEGRLNRLKSSQYISYLKYAHSEREKFLWNKTLEYGIRNYENELKWLKECLISYNKLFGDVSKPRKASNAEKS